MDDATVDVDDDPSALIAAASAGSRAAWDTLVDRYGRLIFTVCRNFDLGAADAADVSQTVWLRLAEHLDRLEQPDRVGAWLVTTARRECLALFRSRARFDPGELDTTDRPSDLPEPEGLGGAPRDLERPWQPRSPC